MRQSYEQRRDYVVSRIAKIDSLDCFVPPAGMFVMLDGSKLANSGDAFAQWLLDEASVSTIPGSGFGPSAGDYVRLSLTVPQTELARAFDRIEQVLSAHQIDSEND